MILSMTGFAAAAAELPGASLAVELRSVNHRFLDVSLRLPEELRSVEPAVRETLSGSLRRGKVECRIALNRAQASTSGLAVDDAQVRKLAAAASEVARIVPDAAPLTVNEVLRWPGVLAEPTVDPAELAAKALALVDEALRELQAARTREGAKTAAVLEQCCLGIEFQVARVNPRVPAVHAAYTEKLAARLRVNPATVVQAYRGLEEAGFVELRQGAGTFVRNLAAEARSRERTTQARRLARQMVAEAARYGLSRQELRDAIRQELDGGSAP